MTPPPQPLWQHNGLAAFNKPPHCETVDPQPGTRPPAFADHVRRALGLPAWQPVHRLDRDTSGLVLFALDPEARKTLEEAFRHRTVEKIYLALCLGIPRNRTGVLRRPLSDWRAGHRPVRVCDRGGHEAETAYQRLLPPVYRRPFAVADDPLSDGVALVAFFPRQGRTHQIRVHAESFGHPVLGDDQYGRRPANRAARERTGLSRQALHAWRVVLPPGSTGPASEAVTLEAPPPDDLRRAMDTLTPGWEAALSDAFPPIPPPR